MDKLQNVSASRLIFFDLNKTLITGGSWYELNIAMGISPEEDELLYRIGPEKEGAIDYNDWLMILKKLIMARGNASRKNIEKALLNYRFIDGAQSVIGQLSACGYEVVIVSGGFDIVVDDVARKLGVQHAYNNSYLVFDADNRLADILTTWDENRYKPLLVRSVCRRFGVSPQDVFYVGDGDNDREVFAETAGVALQPPEQAHEPWKHSAMKNGESFSFDKAAGSARYHISDLRQLLEIVD